MKVLTRKVGQSILIGDDIEVVILEARDDFARIGVRLPKTVSIHRREIYDALAEARREGKPSDTAS